MGVFTQHKSNFFYHLNYRTSRGNTMKLYVGNLGDDGNITSGDLRPLFEQYGTVTECECIKNYAFVHMEEESAATEAVNNLNGHSVKGRPIKVEKSESKGPRKPSQKLFIGNIAEGTTNEELKSVFERFAGVLEADVIKNYGFVHIDANAGRQKVNEKAWAEINVIGADAKVIGVRSARNILIILQTLAAAEDEAGVVAQCEVSLLTVAGPVDIIEILILPHHHLLI